MTCYLELMARASLRLPFVITVATAAACGGTTVVDGEGTGGAPSTGSAGGAMTTGGGSTSSGTMIVCPPEPPPSGDQFCTQGSGSCSYDVACQSGTVELTFSCPEGMWELEATPCAQTFDSCPGTEYYCDIGWWMPLGTNPPSPCPPIAPSPGDVCFTGGMGGVWEHCGYFCASSPVWTIASCVTTPNGPGEWQYDGACGP